MIGHHTIANTTDGHDGPALIVEITTALVRAKRMAASMSNRSPLSTVLCPRTVITVQ